jgi:hypothetical protein
MMLTITIVCNNAAFCDENDDVGEEKPRMRAGTEVARILRILARHYENNGIDRTVPLMDINGNRVGEAEVEG